jgi:NAD(P)H-hydrate epimerase
MGIEIETGDVSTRLAPDLILDGMIGYCLSGPTRGWTAKLIEWANASGRPILALDPPSGLDATTGEARGAVVEADATMTLALPKVGLRRGLEAGVVGELYQADIGVPPFLYGRPPLDLGVPADLFAEGDLLRIA